MPHAVTHILAPLIIVELFRDHFIKNKKSFPLHLVLIAGIAGLLPDLDILAYWILNSISGASMSEVHRTFSHTLFVPMIFLALALILKNIKLKFLAKRKLTLNHIFLMLSFGTFIHILLDGLLLGSIMPFYPMSNMIFALNIVYFLPYALQETFLPALDAVILVLWLAHEELKHRISRFI